MYKKANENYGHGEIKLNIQEWLRYWQMEKREQCVLNGGIMSGRR